ncbi:MAG: VPLPA-CTERM sorting domain-containing protein [Rickettsiales bacterium]
MKYKLLPLILFCFISGTASAASVIYTASGTCEYRVGCEDLSGELTVSNLSFDSNGHFNGDIRITSGFTNSVFLYDFYDPNNRDTVFSTDLNEIIALKWYDWTPGIDAEIIFLDGEMRYDDGRLLFSNVEIVRAVPIPSAAWLLGSALFGLGAARRKHLN